MLNNFEAGRGQQGSERIPEEEDRIEQVLWQAFDGATHVELDPAKVVEARKEEIQLLSQDGCVQEGTNKRVSESHGKDADRSQVGRHRQREKGIHRNKNAGAAE